jgi:hypothetical protein
VAVGILWQWLPRRLKQRRLPPIDAEMSLDPPASGSRLAASTVALVTIGGALGLWLGYTGFGAEGALFGGLGGAALGVALDLLVSSQQDRRARARDSLEGWAAEHGLIYNVSSPVFRDTPFLCAGSAQEGRHGFTGEIFALRGTVYEHITRYGSEQGGGSGDAHHYLVVHLSFDLPGIAFLRVRPRHAAVPNPADALMNRVLGVKEIELESTVLSERCHIDVNESCDELWLRRLLSPQATAALSDICESEIFAGGLYVEAEAGKLVVATPGRIDPERLERLDGLLTAVQPFVLYLEQFAASERGELAAG